MSTVTDLAKKFAELRAASEAQEKILKEINAAWTEVENELLDAMVEEGVNSLKMDGKTFSMTVTNYLAVNAANKENFLAYLKTAGHGSIIKEDVNPRTLTAFLKDHLLEVSNRIAVESGADEFDAKKKALEFLNAKGASYFTKRGISVRSK